MSDLAFLPPDNHAGLVRSGSLQLPALITEAGDQAQRRFLEFFTAHIRNPNTRAAYGRAVGQFLAWCESARLSLRAIEPVHVAAYIEQLSQVRAAPTVKQHLAATRMLFDWLVVGQILPMNPASSVRGPRHVVDAGKTPVLTAEEAKALFESIPKRTVIQLRDRAILGVMVYSFARVSAVVAMDVEDYYMAGRRRKVRLQEKGGKERHLPLHHKAEDYLEAYLEAAGIREERKTALFRTVDRKRQITENRLDRNDVLRMVKRRSRKAGFDSARICCHTFRGTGITTYLQNGGQIETAQAIAGHASARTTKLYDRRNQEVELGEIERIRI